MTGRIVPDDIADAAAGLIGHLAENLGIDPAWRPALDCLGCGQAMLHLAVLTGPFLDLLLDGSKTVESRFSRVRCAPYGVLRPGHVVAVKRPGGPVVGAFEAGHVRSYQLTPRKVSEIREEFSKRICASEDAFWDQRTDCAYATLVNVIRPRTLPGMSFPKRDRRGWAVLTSASATQPTLL